MPARTGPAWARESSAPTSWSPAGCARRASRLTVDGAGNLLGRALGADPSAAEVWTGSHLDTPPDGGRFDGALGVVTGPRRG